MSQQKKYDIFISYRREGGTDVALHLYYLLNRDGYSVSFDLDTLHAGEFAPELLSRVDNCTDFVIILNKDAFKRTLDGAPKEEDWLRIELSRAIEKRKNIIPILMEGFEFPKNNEQLPQDIREVVNFNGAEYSKRYFKAFYAELKEFLSSEPNAQTSIVMPCVKTVTLVHDTLNTPNLIRNAKHHVYLHAAYYPKYADDSYYDNSFKTALRQNPNIDIKVIISSTDATWTEEFALILRDHFTSVDKFKDSLHGSVNFFKQLQERYPNNVQIVYSKALPLAPYIIIDDLILIGHYAHAYTKAPQGLWMEIKHEKILEMCSKNLLEDRNYSDSLDQESQAISRYVEDFQYAFKVGEPIE